MKNVRILQVRAPLQAFVARFKYLFFSFVSASEMEATQGGVTRRKRAVPARVIFSVPGRRSGIQWEATKRGLHDRLPGAEGRGSKKRHLLPPSPHQTILTLYPHALSLFLRATIDLPSQGKILPAPITRWSQLIRSPLLRCASSPMQRRRVKPQNKN